MRRDNNYSGGAGIAGLILMILVVVLISFTINESKTAGPNSNTEATGDASSVLDLAGTEASETTNNKVNAGLDFNKLQEETFDPEDYDDETAQVLKEMGLDPDALNNLELDEEGKFTGDVSLDVEQFRTLADAEADMGYYLGFHNTIKRYTNYELVSMIRVSDLWYQATFEDTSGTHKALTVKCTNNPENAKYLTATYNFNSERIKVIKTSATGVEYTMYQDLVTTDIYMIELAFRNDKYYVIYNSNGLNNGLMFDMATELMDNVRSMDDWE